MICAVSSATAIKSSTVTEAPPAICPSMACAVAAPTLPANLRSKVSKNCGVGSGRYPCLPCRCAADRNSLCACCAPIIRWVIINKSSASAAPRCQPRAAEPLSKALMNCAACTRSNGDGSEKIDPATNANVLNSIDHKTACTTVSSP